MIFWDSQRNSEEIMEGHGMVGKDKMAIQVTMGIICTGEKN